MILYAIFNNVCSQTSKTTKIKCATCHMTTFVYYNKVADFAHQSQHFKFFLHYQSHYLGLEGACFSHSKWCDIQSN